MMKEIEIRDELHAPVSFGGGGSSSGSDSNSSSNVVHDVCVGGYAGTGAWVGGLMTSETGGWGAVPGGMIGTAVGDYMCR